MHGTRQCATEDSNRIIVACVTQLPALLVSVLVSVLDPALSLIRSLARYRPPASFLSWLWSSISYALIKGLFLRLYISFEYMPIYLKL